MKQLLHDIVTIDWRLFHFLRPGALWLFVLLAIVVFILIAGNREQKKWKRFIATALRPYMFSEGNPRAIIFPLVMMVVGASCMILALAGPSWKKRDIPGEKIPAVLMIALDLSKSMLATDIQPSRLERAKLKIVDILNANPRARTGLLAFSGTPHPVLPFTADYRLIKHQAASLNNWEMPVQGTDLRLMFSMVDTMMQRVEAPSTILLMTDVLNEDEAAIVADFMNHSIHRMEILLFSTAAGAIIPGTSNVISKQLPSALDNLRQNKKINITTITLDRSDAEAIAKRISDDLIFEKDSKQDAKEWDDMGWLFLVPALLITAFWFRKGWVVQWCWIPLMLFSFSSCGVESKHPGWWYKTDYQGEMWYEKGDYEKASELFQDPSHKADAYFKAGNFQAAAELLAEDTTAIGEYNYGLTLAKLSAYDEAINAFNSAATKDPALKEKVEQNIQASQLMKDHAGNVLRFNPEESAVDRALKATEKEKLKERKPQSEDEKLSSDTEVKKLPTHGDRLTDETESDIRHAKEQQFPPKDFKMDSQIPIDTKILMQKTNADPGEFLHRRFEIQKQKYFPDVKPEKDAW